MNEDQILTRIALEVELAKLDPEVSEMMCLIYRIEMPEDWTGRWPPTFEGIGHYIGMKFRGKAMSEAAIRYRLKAVKKMWRGERGKLRRNRR